MKKLPLFITVCLLVSVTAWAGWSLSPSSLKTINTLGGVPTISCSADGQIIYLAINDNVQTHGGKVRLFRSLNGGETWSEQVFIEPK